MEEKILFIYDFNIFTDSFGTKKRFYEVLKKLQNRGYTLHQVAFGPMGRELMAYGAPWDSDLIEKRFCFFKIGSLGSLRRIASLILPRWAVKLIKKVLFLGGQRGEDIMTEFIFKKRDKKIKKKLDRLVKQERYSTILASYCYYAPYLKDYRGVNKVLFIEDVISTQAFETPGNCVPFKTLFEAEVEAVNSFDHAFCISPDELKLFAEHATRPAYQYLPPVMEKGSLLSGEEKYDFLFIGFANRHNQVSLQWLMDEVFPLLKEYRIVVVGKVGGIYDYTAPMPYVSFIPYCDDLPRLYHESRVALSPMFSGTGVKIKVIEALSYGRPAVCTDKGAIGLPGAFEGEGIVVRNDSRDFAAEAERLVTDDEYYRSMSRRALSYFERNFTGEKADGALDKVFPSLVE